MIRSVPPIPEIERMIGASSASRTGLQEDIDRTNATIDGN